MDKRYVPILWGREGEFGAMRTLEPEIRGAITPIVQVPPVPWDHENDCPAKTVDEHVRSFIAKVDEAWGEREVGVDLWWIESERLADGRHPVAALFDDARAQGMRIVPVAGPERSVDYNAAIRHAISIDRRGVIARVQLQDLDSRSELGPQTFATLWGCDPDDVDLLIDAAHVTSENVQPAAAIAERAINRLTPASWRSIILAAGAFPENLGTCARMDATNIPRLDWQMWLELRSRVGSVAFSDYGIAHPAPSDVDPRIMKASASIRYTIEDDWLVLKARGLDRGFEQFHDLCRALVRRRDYSRASFSWGDAYIRECARDMEGPGNLTTWRQVGTSHHLSFVVRQIASLLARGGGPVPAGAGR